MNHLFANDASATRLFAEAQAHGQRGRLDLALKQYLELIQRRLARHRPLEEGDWRLAERIAHLAVPFGLTDAADHLLAACAANHEQAGRAFPADTLTLHRVHVALAAGLLPKALDLLTSLQRRIGALTEIPGRADALPAWEETCRWPPGPIPPDRELFFARLYRLLGRWLAARGCYGHAVVLLQRGSELARPPASEAARRERLPLRLALAGVFLEQGRLADCDDLLEEIQEAIDEEQYPAWRVQWLELAAQVGLRRGDHGRALDQLARIVSLCVAGGFERATLGALLNQAEVLILVNQVAVAEETLVEAGERARRLGDRTAQARVAWLLRLARERATSPVGMGTSATEMQAGAAPGAETPPASADDAATFDLPQADNYLAFFEDRALGVQWALGRGNVALADDLLAGMREVFGRCESPLIQLRLHALAGMVAYHGGDIAAADRIFTELDPHLERLGLKPERWQATRFRAWCAVRLGQGKHREQALQAQAQRLLEEMAASLDPSRRAVYLLNKWTIEEKSLLQELQELEEARRRVERSPWYVRWWRRWRSRRRLHAFLLRLDENRRQLAADAVGAQAPARPLTLWQRLWGHSWRSATLSFLVLPDRVFVARASWLTLDFVVLPLTRVRVRELVRSWHQGAVIWIQALQDWLDAQERGFPAALLEARTREMDRMAAEQQELLRALVAELHLADVLRPLPGRVRRLTVVADDALHGLPFAALPLADGCLGDRFALTMAFDRSVLPARRVARADGEAVTLAVSRRGQVELAAGHAEIPELQGVLSEAEETGRWLSAAGLRVCRFVDEHAERAAVLEAWSRASFVHAACHGIFQPDRPDASGLVLVSASGRGEVLSLRDLAALDLQRLRHVTLSCCWGADNFVLPGRWIVSLPETLCRRGAGSVLACLWQVEDEVGREFCRLFYELLARLPRDQALQEAQRACRENRLLPPNRKRRTEHPFYWAGYRLHGDGGPLSLGE